MEFQFDKISEEMLKILLESKEKERFVISGSYALYKIHFKDYKFPNNLLIEFKDLDFDVNNLINQNKSKIEIKEIINEYLNNNFLTIFTRLKDYTNILEYEINLNKIIIDERKNNQNNFGATVKIEIKNRYNSYLFKFDIGFETKQFEILKKEINILNKTYNVKVYDLEKTLADKYLAILKRLDVIINKVIDEQAYRSNLWKLSKDLYDINIIKTQNLNKTKIKNNIQKMIHPKYEINIDDFINFVNEMVEKHSEILEQRGFDLFLKKDEINKFVKITTNNNLEI